MDNSTNDLLRELTVLQKEQNDLLKRYLWRLRFSLGTLFLLMTAVCVGLGTVVYKLRDGSQRSTVANRPWYFAPPSVPTTARLIPTTPPGYPFVNPGPSSDKK